MPVSLTSRYRNAEVYTPDQGGESLPPTLAMRPGPFEAEASFRHVVVAGETMEYLAWRYFGSSDAWWRIADANPLIFPLDLPTARAVSIPSETDFGRVVRNRSF